MYQFCHVFILVDNGVLIEMCSISGQILGNTKIEQG